MNTKKVEDLDFYLLPGKPGVNFRDQDLHDRVYVYWRDFWQQVLGELGVAAALQRDDFLRQDRVAVLVHGEEVVGVHLYTCFDLTYQATREHSYFTRYYPQAFFAALKQRGVATVMSMEYFSVSPQWRASKVGVSLGSVMIGLGLRVAADLGVHAAVAPARRDNGVLALGRDQGVSSIIENVMINNAPCDLCACFAGDVRPSADPKVNELIARFWEDCQDMTRTVGLPPLRAVS